MNNLKELGKVKFEVHPGHTFTPSVRPDYPPRSSVNRFGKPVSLDHLDDNSRLTSLDSIELAWQNYFLFETPNGDLLRHNSLHETIKKRQGVSLLHCTPSLKEILQSGNLKPSGGCLGASVYCAPINPDGRAHNLSQFIIQRELPGALKSSGRNKEINLLLIDIHPSNFNQVNIELGGMDYLRFGPELSEVYRQFKIHPPIVEAMIDFEFVERNLLLQIKLAREFLNLCVEYDLDEFSNKEFEDMLSRAINSMPTISYILFEVCVEYISLFQDSQASNYHKDRGELYNWHFKMMAYDLCPKLYSGFRLIEFRPTLQDISQYLCNLPFDLKPIKHFNEEHFYNFFKWRIAQYVRYKFMDCTELPKKVTSYDQLMIHNPSLAGHLIHRELKTYMPIHALVSEYEKLRSKMIWNTWNKMGIVYPFYAVMPKGEVGINPHYPKLAYSIYHASIEQDGHIKRVKELPITLGKQMSEPAQSIMRSVVHT